MEKEKMQKEKAKNKAKFTTELRNLPQSSQSTLRMQRTQRNFISPL